MAGRLSLSVLSDRFVPVSPRPRALAHAVPDLDRVRRAFTLYDMTYNLALMASAGVCVIVLPESGYSVAVMGFAALGYVVLAVVYAFAPRQPRPLPVGAV